MGKYSRGRSGVALNDRGVARGVLMVAGSRQLAAIRCCIKKARSGWLELLVGVCQSNKGEI